MASEAPTSDDPAGATDADRPTQAADGTAPGGDDAVGGPPPREPDEPRAKVVWQLTRQALSCAAMGSPLSAFLLTQAAADVLEDGPCAELLLADVRPGRGDAAALRFLAALHRLVLDRRAPQLALHYPSVGGTPDLRRVGAVMVDTVAAHAEVLPALVAQPCQTNEVGRSAGLLVGLLDVAITTGLPLALREVGSSAGLNLRLDHFAYELPDGRSRAPASEPPARDGRGGTRRLGPDDADLVFTGRYRAPLPPPAGDAATMPDVVDRRGCDLHPIDPTTPEGRARVSSSVWCDQVDRFERLGAALRTAQRVPAAVDRASAAAWTAAQLAGRPQGAVTVVFHSVVQEYLPADERSDLFAAVETAGADATAAAPIAHVRLEPVTSLRHHGISVRIWPHAPRERVLATCGAHGTDVTPR